MEKVDGDGVVSVGRGAWIGLDSALTSLAMGPEDMCGRGIEQKRVIFFGWVAAWLLHYEKDG